MITEAEFDRRYAAHLNAVARKHLRDTRWGRWWRMLTFRHYKEVIRDPKTNDLRWRKVWE